MRKKYKGLRKKRDMRGREEKYLEVLEDAVKWFLNEFEHKHWVEAFDWFLYSKQTRSIRKASAFAVIFDDLMWCGGELAHAIPYDLLDSWGRSILIETMYTIMKLEAYKEPWRLYELCGMPSFEKFMFCGYGIRVDRIKGDITTFEV